MAETAAAPETKNKPEKIPLHFQLNEKLIDAATVRAMTFMNYSNYITEAIAMTQPADIDARLRRIRMSRQLDYHVNGATVPVSTDDVTKLPIPDARKIIARLGNLYGDKPRGKIVRDGDGIHQARDSVVESMAGALLDQLALPK